MRIAVMVASLIAGSVYVGHVRSDETPSSTPSERTARSGPWSDPSTWETGKVPVAGAKVLIQPGHRVVYDVESDQVIRAICISGELSFATERDPPLRLPCLALGSLA